MCGRTPARGRVVGRLGTRIGGAARVDGDPLSSDEPPALRLWVYAVVVVGVAVLALAGVLPRWPGLAHEVALPPLDLFADVRVLMARAPSAPVFVLGVAVAVAARAALLATILGSTRRQFGFVVRFYLAALAPALLASGLDFSGRAILYAYLIWGGLLISVVTFLALGPAPWVARGKLRVARADAGRRRFRPGALLLYLVALTIIGDIWRRPGGASQVLVVPLSGALSVLMARRLAREPARRLSSRWVAIVTAVALLTVGAVVAVPRLGGSSGHTAAAPRAGSLLLVAGVDTSTGHGALFRLDPGALGFSCRQTFYYSYRGQGAGGPQGDARCPIRTGAPYGRADTTRPLHLLASALRDQLVGLDFPVVVVTHSQGAFIAWSELATDHADAVRALVMLAPFAEGLAPYPPPGHDGTGAVGGTAVRLVTDLGRAAGISRFDPDAPLARELQAKSGAIERLVARPLPRSLRVAAIVARGDLPLEPRLWPHHVPEACPGWLAHAGLPTSSRVLVVAGTFLDGRAMPGCPRWVAALGHASDAYGAPSPAAIP